MNLYTPHYVDLLRQATVTREVLPNDLQRLITTYDHAFAVLERTPTSTQQQTVWIMAKADAMICAAIYNLYHDRISVTDTASENATDIDKIKLLALKARAIKMKHPKNK
ncbi:hypothetical protein HGH93_12090 [Chitinophaga polysaccharea]|uniref:hypothetical protein n=1 Tax=Chitinophaga polysaccharea TaxID=1293035 RepID=UPI001455CEDE|nr:hypothetical protein [Chitinophaga polysaccharea]NLR58847.1 hypothetical protein [Chitinophaga polysaccharea]